MIFQFDAFGQIEITGTVYAKNDTVSLPGVSVIEKGTNNGILTNKNGEFTLLVKDIYATLTVSYIGLEIKEVSLEGKTKLSIELKPTCHRDFFDHQRIGLNLKSGIFKNPFGGQIDINFPAFLSQTTLKSSVGYQTNFKENKQINALLGLFHIAVSCYYDMDIYTDYQENFWDNSFEFKSYSIKTNLNFSELIFNTYFRLILGYNMTEYSNNDLNNQTKTGPVIGVGTWIGRPINVMINTNISILGGINHYQGSLNKRFKRINIFANYHQFETFKELSFGIGYIFTYRIKKNKNKRSTTKI